MYISRYYRLCTLFVCLTSSHRSNDAVLIFHTVQFLENGRQEKAMDEDGKATVTAMEDESPIPAKSAKRKKT